MVHAMVAKCVPKSQNATEQILSYKSNYINFWTKIMNRFNQNNKMTQVINESKISLREPIV